MWNSSNQYRALATRKLRTSVRPKLKTRVPQSGCSPWRGSACSYSAVPSKRASAHSSFGKCAGHPVDDDAHAALVERVDERPEVVGGAVAGGRRVVAGDLVAPRAAEGVLGHGHELDVGEAQRADVVGEGLGSLGVGERPPVGPGRLVDDPPPRREVHLVDRQVPVELVGGGAGGEPGLVAPDVAVGLDDAGGGRRELGGARHGVGLEPGAAVGADDLELVALPGDRAGREALPHARAAERPQAGAARVPVVEVDRRPRPHGPPAPTPRTTPRRRPGGCARARPSMRHSCRWRPSLNRYRSTSPTVGSNDGSSGAGGSGGAGGSAPCGGRVRLRPGLTAAGSTGVGRPRAGCRPTRAGGPARSPPRTRPSPARTPAAARRTRWARTGTSGSGPDDRRAVAVEERGAGPRLPGRGERAQLGVDVVAPLGERHVGRVVERAHHARHVAQGRGRQHPLVERA